MNPNPHQIRSESEFIIAQLARSGKGPRSPAIVLLVYSRYRIEYIRIYLESGFQEIRTFPRFSDFLDLEKFRLS